MFNMLINEHSWRLICPSYLSSTEDKMLFKVVTLWPSLLFWQTLMVLAPQKAKVHVRTSLEAITLNSRTSYIKSNEFLEKLILTNKTFQKKSTKYISTWLVPPYQEQSLEVELIRMSISPYFSETSF